MSIFPRVGLSGAVNRQDLCIGHYLNDEVPNNDDTDSDPLACGWLGLCGTSPGGRFANRIGWLQPNACGLDESTSPIEYMPWKAWLP